MPLTPRTREALLWLGGAALIALAIAAYLLFSTPEFDDLAQRYSVL